MTLSAELKGQAGAQFDALSHPGEPSPSSPLAKWCLTHKDEAGPRKRRKILGELPNQATRVFVPQICATCDCHGTPHRRKSDCWTLYHSHVAQIGSDLP